ncbi:MAG: MAPEG family protein [Wenzhouxiangellaceae bacterium]
MQLVAIVIGIALIEYLVFSALVGKARATYEIHAPATTGNEMFERYFRVHMNTLEALILFIPSILLFANYVNAVIGAGIGVVFVIGRIVFFKSYIKDPKSRQLGAMLSGIPSVALLLGGIIGAAIDYF